MAPRNGTIKRYQYPTLKKRAPPPTRQLAKPVIAPEPVGLDEPCSCGSLIKYLFCCGARGR